MKKPHAQHAALESGPAPLGLAVRAIACALPVSYYLAARTAGFSDPARFLGSFAVWATAVGLALAALRWTLRRTLAGDDLERILAPSAILLLEGVEAVRPVPALGSFLPFAAIAWIGARASDRVARAGGEGAKRWIEASLFGGLTGIGLFFLFQPVVIHDAFQYLATLRGLLVGRSTDLFEDLFVRNSLASYNPFPEGSLRYLGVAILEVPAYIAGGMAARLANRMGGVHPTNGYTLPYLLSISLFSCLCGVGALLVSYRAASRRASRRSALVATIGFFLASPLVFFTFQWHGWTHTYGALLAAVFLDAWLASADDPRGLTTRGAVVMGATGGFGVIVWPPAGLLFALPAMDLALRIAAGGRVRDERRSGVTFAPAAAMAAAALVGFSPQLAGWKLATGSFLGSTYATIGDHFDWLHPHLWGFLFSGPRHGAVAWNPILVPCVAGLVLLRGRRERAALVLVVAASVAALSCWSIWWTGIGFGNRFLLGLSPLFVLGLARLLDRIGRGRAGRLAGGAIVLLVFWNLALLGAYRLDRIRMGIKAPSYVQDPAPSAGRVARLLLVESPFDPGRLLRSFHFNRNFFGERLVKATRAGRWGESASLAAALALLGAAAGTLARFVLRQPGPSSHGVPLAILLLAASVASSLFLLAACLPGPPRIERVHIDGSWEPIDRGKSVELVPRAGSGPASTIHVLSFLTYAGDIDTGTVVAEVRVHGTHGEREEHPLRAGVETAEVSWARPEFRERMRHGIEDTDPVRTWIDDVYSAHLYPLHVYRARIDLARPFEVAAIEVRYVHRVGAMQVTDVFLR